MSFNLIFVLVMGGVCYFVLPFLLWLIKNEKARTVLTIIFFSLFILVLFAGVFGQISIDKKTVSVSFNFDGEWFSKSINTNVDLKNITKFDLIINLVMLLPVGMFVVFMYRKARWWGRAILLVLFGVMSGIFIEIMQYSLPIDRYVQLTDVILNAISVVAGGVIAWIYLGIIKLIRKSPTL